MGWGGVHAEVSIMKIVAFTKSFQDLTISQVASAFKKLGLDGLDLTVRDGGHIAPANVERELPDAVNVAHEKGLTIPLLTTGITDADAAAETLFNSAATVGITRIKLGYYRYRPVGTLAKQMDEVKHRLARLVPLARKYGVLPCVHIHSGTFIPSHGTMLYELIKDFPPNEVGAYVDPLHMTLEGGGEGWRQGLDLLAPWIALVSVKNFAWQKGHRDPVGQQRWETKTVPLAEGVAPLPDFMSVLKKLDFDGIYSLHSEYKGNHSFKDLDTDGCLVQTAQDLAFFKKLF